LGKAFAAFREALRIRTFEAFPIDYANTQFNLGEAYSMLAEVKDKEVNLEKARAAYTEALRFCSIDASTVNYDKIKDKIGNLPQI